MNLKARSHLITQSFSILNSQSSILNPGYCGLRLDFAFAISPLYSHTLTPMAP